MTSLVAGAGGFIGGHLVRYLLDQGQSVVAVDIKPKHEWFQWHSAATNVSDLDLSLKANAYYATESAKGGVTKSLDVYNLAADMGGMGFIANHKAECMLSVLINTHLLMAARDMGVSRYFYASSACVYPSYRQDTVDNVALAEPDAYPADPEDGYGWEKLFSERLCLHYREDFGLVTRPVRFHNVYGPFGTWTGGREKAPAAICRKVIEAQLTSSYDIEIWGDGNQTRSFMYIDDCLYGIDLIMKGDFEEPLNLGSRELVTINQLVDIVEELAGVRLERTYNLDAPQGVRGRNSDNTLILDTYGWEPSTALEDGMAETFAWIKHQMTTGDVLWPNDPSVLSSISKQAVPSK